MRCSQARFRSSDSARKLAARYGNEATVYETYEEMLSDKAVDIVSICMPNYLHAREAVLAFKAKKHLILEKNFARPPKKRKHALWLASFSAGIPW